MFDSDDLTFTAVKVLRELLRGMGLFEGHLEGVEAEVTERGDLLSSSCCQITFSHVICLAAETQLPLPAVSNDISIVCTEDWQRIMTTDEGRYSTRLRLW